MSQKTALAAFVKYPEPGRVKTRLARALSDVEASRLYRQIIQRLVRDVFVKLPSAEFDTIWVCDPFRDIVEYRAELPEGNFLFRLQRGGNLGERLANCAQELLAEYSNVVIVATDCAELSADDLLEARAKLNSSVDVVLGPSFDGGYYLIGLKRSLPYLFEEIPWSTRGVFDATLFRANEKSLNVETLRMLSDLDTIEDYHRLKHWF